MSSLKDIKSAHLISSRPHQVPGKLLVTELFFEVPLDHARPEGSKLRIFCRSGKKFETPAAPHPKGDEHLPWFVYIPGGPGFGCPPPQNIMEVTTEVLGRGYQVSKEPICTPSVSATTRGSPLTLSVPLLRPSWHGSLYECHRRHGHREGFA